MNDQIPEPFKGAMYDVEHAFGMYADSYCILPAEAIYDDKLLADYKDVIRSCHIYMIGLIPLVKPEEARQEGRSLVLTVSILGNKYNLVWPLPDGANVKSSGEYYFVEDQDGRRFSPSQKMIFERLGNTSEPITFDVQYIGQAYGKSGSRNAIDRLLKHETLQKISLQGIPEGYNLSIVLLEIQPANQLFTVFNPWAEKKDDDESAVRIKAGVDKMFNTSEKEQVALYEASLIKYFNPKFNKIFKDSFPSTNLKVLQDCYEKDFSAVIAEICFDNLPFRLCSDAVKPILYHIARHHLHDDSARQVFFGMDWKSKKIGSADDL